MAQWLSGLWCWIYHVCLGFKSFEWQNILHLDCHGLDWIPFEILRSKNKGWIDPMGLTFPRMDQSNELQFLNRPEKLFLVSSDNLVPCHLRHYRSSLLNPAVIGTQPSRSYPAAFSET